MSATPKMLNNRLKIDVKREVTKRSMKNRRQIDTVGSLVLKKVPKGQPDSQMQQSFIFLSQEDPGGGYRLKKHRNSVQNTIETC